MRRSTSSGRSRAAAWSAGPADEPFIRHLFEEVRTGQFAATGLSGPIVRQVLAQQFHSQTAGYTTQFPDAISLIVTRDGSAIGRLLFQCASACWHIIDISLLPDDCGRGLGTKIIQALAANARYRGVGMLTLSVLTGNLAARRFYLRHGFAEIGQAGAAHIAMSKNIV